MRAIDYVRLSKLTETSTSPERQRATNAKFIDARGWDHVDTIEDIDVSASKHRLDRPGIHEIRRRIAAGEADVVVVTRLDRIARNVADVSALLDEGIAIVSATEAFDTASPSGRAMAQVAQVFAELEARTIGARVASSRKHLPTVGRWPGGPTPYGFTTAPIPGEPGRTLAHDPAEFPVARRIVEEALSGASLLSITRRLNEDKIPPRRGADWSRTVVARWLRSGAIRGHARVSGERLRDDVGLPRTIWPPIVSVEEGRELDRLLAPHAKAPRVIDRKDFLLAGLAICSGCHRVMTTRIARTGRATPLHQYVCQTRNRGGICPTPQTVKAEAADIEAERQFLRALGGVDVIETTTQAEPAEGLSDVLQAIDETTSAMRTARPEDIMDLASRLVSLQAERERLDRPVQVAQHRRTGETYADLWVRLTLPQRRDLLLSSESYAIIHPAQRRGLFTPDRIEVLDHLAGQLT